ncbi:MAG: hypothetical protein KDK39_02085 [Leptospiraceae bacterium]|nr:hypothetical protein [Leptospiraceae bacterium]
MKRKITLLTLPAILAGILAITNTSDAFSVAEKAQKRRIEMIQYLRFMKPMVYNFPCEPFPDCYVAAKKNDKIGELDLIARFSEVKRVYQEGMVYYYEGQYLKAYNRFLDSQVRIEAILERLSQWYINRTEVMMRDALEKKNQDDPEDMSLIDVSIEYGPNSRKRRDFSDDREAPHTARRYDSRETHWARNKWVLENNLAKGYERLGLARKARALGLEVDRKLRKHEKTTPDQREKRIEYYLASIQLARQAKQNAAYIFQLKYPYDNYALMNTYGLSEAGRKDDPQVPKLEDITMNWSKNPYVFPVRLHPVFDLRLPAKYRRDATDSRQELYEEEVDILVRMKYYNEERRNKIEGLDYKRDQAASQ